MSLKDVIADLSEKNKRVRQRTNCDSGLFVAHANVCTVAPDLIRSIAFGAFLNSIKGICDFTVLVLIT